MNQILIGIILAGGIAGYFYYNNTQAELIELRDLNMAYELKFEEQEKAMSALKADFDLQSTSLLDMQAKNQEIQIEMNRYLDIFKRHNLTKLAAAKPGLIENKANKGTKEVFDGIEADSASIDSLDNGVQLFSEGASGSQDSNEADRAQDNSTSSTKSH
jgi:type II secretory pathway pseudopilin PulG